MADLQSGQIVQVYHDPGTCQELEGCAKLVMAQRSMPINGLSLWWVKFVGYDSDPTCLRAINVEHI